MLLLWKRQVNGQRVSHCNSLQTCTAGHNLGYLKPNFKVQNCHFKQQEGMQKTRLRFKRITFSHHMPHGTDKCYYAQITISFFYFSCLVD